MRQEDCRTTAAMGKPGHQGVTAGASLVGAAFVVLNLILVVRGGIRVIGDGTWYVASAHQLAHGGSLTPEQASCAGYIALVALCLRSGVGLPGVVVLQLIMAALAAAAQYNLGARVGGPLSGLIAAGLIAANPDVQRWNGLILTESLYISLSVISIWTAIRAAERGGAWYLAAILASFTTAAIRTNGLLLLSILLLYWIACGRFSSNSRRGARLLAAGVLISLLLLGFLSYPPLRARLRMANLGQQLQSGVVVWGYPAGNMRMPPQISDERPAGVWSDAAGYAFHHPLACFRLLSLRVGMELLHSRPFYSLIHNLVVWVYLAPVYVLAVMGAFRQRRAPETFLLIAIISAQLLLVALTWADWDGRFLLYVLPFITVLSSWGLASPKASKLTAVP